MRWSAEHPGGHAGVRFVPMAVRLDKYLSSNHPDIAIAAALLFLAGLVDALLIGSFAGTGLLLGLASLLLVHRIVAARMGTAAGWALAIGSLALTSLGVYLGRFPRFNSWDVVTNPQGLVDVVLGRLLDPFGNPFLLQFAAAMTGGLVAAYLVTWASGRALEGGHRGGVAQYGG